MSAARPRRQRGVAAVELALLLPMLLTLLAFMLLFVRVFIAYNIMQDAAQHAARYMASIPPADMGDYTQRTAAMAVARKLVENAAASAGLPPFQGTAMIGVKCDADSCDYDTSMPLTVHVSVAQLKLPVAALERIHRKFGAGAVIKVRLDATVPYGH